MLGQHAVLPELCVVESRRSGRDAGCRRDCYTVRWSAEQHELLGECSDGCLIWQNGRSPCTETDSLCVDRLGGGIIAKHCRIGGLVLKVGIIPVASGYGVECVCRRPSTHVGGNAEVCPDSIYVLVNAPTTFGISRQRSFHMIGVRHRLVQSLCLYLKGGVGSGEHAGQKGVSACRRCRASRNGVKEFQFNIVGDSSALRQYRFSRRPLAVADSNHLRRYRSSLYRHYRTSPLITSKAVARSPNCPLKAR